MTKNEAVFTKDTANKTISVVRKFDAHQQQVWDAWTQSQILDQWWAPKPWKAGTKGMNFREGGEWFYYMEGPDGERHYCKFKYKTINPITGYSGTDMFCDENGNRNTEFPSMAWSLNFTEDEGQTTVNITINFDRQEDMETILKMGFEEGFKMGLGNLDEYFAGQ